MSRQFLLDRPARLGRFGAGLQMRIGAHLSGCCQFRHRVTADARGNGATQVAPI